ncbi:MAG: LuxR C-terminal-related transcriptional regulator [Miltoncostaeaceae bacterium]
MAEPTNERSCLAAGQAALARGAWAEAIAALDASLAAAPTPEAHEGRALAARWLEDGDAVLEHRLEAYRLYQEADDGPAAARLAMLLAETYGELRGDLAVAQGWMQRAERLLADEPTSPEHARLTILRAAIAGFMGDRSAARALSQEAASSARSIGAVDMEVLAMAVEGRARVAEGDVSAGMALLDEATAAATSGEVTDLEVVPAACCFMITACERVRDFERAAGWCDTVQEVCGDYLSQSLFAYCRTSYAGALVWWGEWGDAESQLESAIELTAGRGPMTVGEPLRRLAELRVRQGRLEEAGELLERVEGLPAAALARAALALEAGSAQEASDLAERFLRSISQDSPVERVAGLEIALRASLSTGDTQGAEDARAQLRAVADAVGTDPLLASARLADGLLVGARGDHEGARVALEDAIDLFERSRAPFEAGCARCHLAEQLIALGRTAGARDELRLARSLLRRVGAAGRAEWAEERLGELDSRSRAGGGESEPGPLTPRECEVLRLVADGLGDREIAERLVLSEHTVHRHVSNIRTKLGVSSRAAAAAQAARLGLI